VSDIVNKNKPCKILIQKVL